MKKLSIILALFLSFTGFGQIDIEVFHPEDGYKHHVNDSATVCIEMVDSMTLVIQDNNGKAYYDIGKVTTIVAGTKDNLFTITEYMIINDYYGLTKITTWENIHLVMFEYENKLTVLNSGRGITYY